jgi:hypothetical protein
MATSISDTELARNLSEFLTRVADRQEHFQIRKGDRIMAELRPPSGGSTFGDLAKLFKSLPKMPDDEAEAFQKDLEAIRNEASQDKGRNPWAD